MLRLCAALLAATAAVCGAIAIGGNAGVSYPTDFRTWQHVKSMIIQPGHSLEDPFGGIHHIYANPKAVTGLRGGRYDDGAVFVFDLLNYDEGDHVIVEADRKRIDIMQYDRKLFAETGGWGFETFAGDSKTERLVKDGGASCFGCHQSAESSNYVFSKLRP